MVLIILEGPLTALKFDIQNHPIESSDYLLPAYNIRALSQGLVMRSDWSLENRLNSQKASIAHPLAIEAFSKNRGT